MLLLLKKAHCDLNLNYIICFSKSRIYRDCSKLSLGKAKETRQAIEDSISEALLHSPSIIIFDDLDSVISVSSDPQVSQSSSSSDSPVRYLADIMDEFKVRRYYDNSLYSHC